MQLAIEAAGRQFRDQHHHVRRRLEAWRLGDGGIGTPAALNRQPAGSARHSEDERIRCPRAGVVGRHPLAEPPQVDPHVGVGRGAEVCLLAEHFLGQSLLRHRPVAIGDPLLHEKPQQILEPPRALQNTRHGVAVAQIFQYSPFQFFSFRSKF